MDKKKSSKNIGNKLDLGIHLIDVSKWKKEYLENMSVYCKDRFQNINHPLVLSGEAFWYDNNTICMKNK